MKTASPWQRCTEIVRPILDSLYASRDLRLPDRQVHHWVCDIPFLEQTMADALCQQLAATKQLPPLLPDSDLRASQEDRALEWKQQRMSRHLALRLEFCLDVCRHPRWRADFQPTGHLPTDLLDTLVTRWHARGCQWAAWRYGEATFDADSTPPDE